MAFCNSCGAPLSAGTSFCNKCGTAAAGPGAAPASFPPPPPTTGGGSALKIVLIVIAVIVGIGILGLGSLAIIGYHIAKSVTQEGDHVKVETPFGSVETSKDPAQVVKDLGVDVYPGAQAQKNGTATVTFGNMHTVAASFESSDSVDQVCTFYKSRFPKATVNTSDQNRCSIVSGDPKNMITISVQNHGGTTKFQISNVSKTPGSSNSGSSN